MAKNRIEKRREKQQRKTDLRLRGFVLHGIASGVTREVLEYLKELLTSS